MNRKDTLKALLGSSTPAPQKEAPKASDTLVADQPSPRVGSGAVRAMGLSLQKLTAEADQGAGLASTA